MRVVIIGAGNVATHLAKALSDKAIAIVQILSRTLPAATDLAAQLPDCQPITWEGNLDATADCYIVAVSDDEIERVGDLLATRLPDTALVVHTSGATPASVFAERHRLYGIFYPLQTFTKDKKVQWDTVPLLINATTPHSVAILSDMAHRLTQKVYTVTDEQKSQLHLAAVFVNNFSNVMYQIGEDLLQKTHLPFELLHPLILETAQKIRHLSPVNAQTGPARRQDMPTIERHLQQLQRINNDFYTKVYQDLTNFILSKYPLS